MLTVRFGSVRFGSRTAKKPLRTGSNRFHTCVVSKYHTYSKCVKIMENDEFDDDLRDHLLSDSSSHQNESPVLAIFEVERSQTDPPSLSPELVPIRGKRRRSLVWDMFKKESDHNVCVECGKRYDLSSSTSTLAKHLRSHRPSFLLKPEVTEDQGHTPSRPLDSNAIDRLLAEWVLSTAKPFSMIGS